MKKLITNLLFFIIPIVTLPQNLFDSVMETNKDVKAIFENFDNFFHLIDEQFNEEYLCFFYYFPYDGEYEYHGAAIGDFDSELKILHLRVSSDNVKIKDVNTKDKGLKKFLKYFDKKRLKLIKSIPNGQTIFDLPYETRSWHYVTYVNKSNPNKVSKKSFLELNGAIGDRFFGKIENNPSPLRDLFYICHALTINTCSL